MSIITLGQAKAQLRIPDSDTSKDADIQGYVDAITGVVERYKGIVIEPRSCRDVRGLSGATAAMLRNVPVLSLTTVAAIDSATTWDPAAMYVDPDSGVLTVLSGPPLNGLVAFTYKAGCDPVPVEYVRGALVILQHNWETQRGVGTARTGVVGAEEHYDPRTSYSIPRKALEWLGQPLGGVA